MIRIAAYLQLFGISKHANLAPGTLQLNWNDAANCRSTR